MDQICGWQPFKQVTPIPNLQWSCYSRLFPTPTPIPAAQISPLLNFNNSQIAGYHFPSSSNFHGLSISVSGFRFPLHANLRDNKKDTMNQAEKYHSYGLLFTFLHHLLFLTQIFLFVSLFQVFLFLVDRCLDDTVVQIMSMILDKYVFHFVGVSQTNK